MINATVICLTVTAFLLFAGGVVAAIIYERRKGSTADFLKKIFSSASSKSLKVELDNEATTYLKKLKNEKSIPMEINTADRPKRHVEVTLSTSLGMRGQVSTERTIDEKQVEVETTLLKAKLKDNVILNVIIVALTVLGMIFIILAGFAMVKPLTTVDIIGMAAAAIVGILPSLLWRLFKKP